MCTKCSHMLNDSNFQKGNGAAIAGRKTHSEPSSHDIGVEFRQAAPATAPQTSRNRSPNSLAERRDVAVSRQLSTHGEAER